MAGLVELAMLVPNRPDSEKAHLSADTEPAIRRIGDSTRSLVRLAKPEQIRPQLADLPALREQALTCSRKAITTSIRR